MSGVSRRQFLAQSAALTAGLSQESLPDVPLLTGRVEQLRIGVARQEHAPSVKSARLPADIDLHAMAGWAMNYLIRTPRKDLGYEPVFQCHPYACPPIPAGSDPVVACDTDARMDWEWYYMRDVSGSAAGKDVETAFHKRMRDYIAPDGKVWSHPGCYNEGLTSAKYRREDYVVHVWGATKILHSLSEAYSRSGDRETKELARKVMLGLRSLATTDQQGRAWFAGGMGAWKDGKWVKNGWNRQPAPVVGSLLLYWQATGDEEGLSFAKAYADGMVDNCQPGGIRFQPDGSFRGHSHATMHAVWGVGELGVALNEKRYLELAHGAFNYLLTRGTGTGWFPAGPDNCNETCCISDMVSVAALLGRAGRTEYFDAVERYIRNYISPLQFIVTPEYVDFYKERNAAKGEEAVRQGLQTMARFQGGVIGGSGLNDYENQLLGGASGFEMFGCCAPEGMRAIHTAWKNVIEERRASAFGPTGIYVNLGFNRDSQWGRVWSFFPEQGRVSVQTKVAGDFFLRPPSWAPRGEVRAFRGRRPVSVSWSGSHLRFPDVRRGEEISILYPLVEFRHSVRGLWSRAKDLEMRYDWRGNMVMRVDPPARRLPLYTGKPRVLPAPPVELA